MPTTFLNLPTMCFMLYILFCHGPGPKEAQAPRDFAPLCALISSGLAEGRKTNSRVLLNIWTFFHSLNQPCSPGYHQPLGFAHWSFTSCISCLFCSTQGFLFNRETWGRSDLYMSNCRSAWNLHWYSWKKRLSCAGKCKLWPNPIIVSCSTLS